MVICNRYKWNYFPYYWYWILRPCRQRALYCQLRKSRYVCFLVLPPHISIRLADSMMIPESKVSESIFGISFRDQNNKQNIKNVGKCGHRFLPTCFYLQYLTNFHFILFSCLSVLVHIFPIFFNVCLLFWSRKLIPKVDSETFDAGIIIESDSLMK